MEERVEEKNPRSTRKIGLFKRFVCLLLVLSIMLSLTACAYINGEPASLAEAGVYVVGGLIRATTLVIGDLTLAGIVWVLDKITWPFYRLTGFNMDKPATVIFKFFNNLVDPNHVHGDWSDLEVELHDEHPKTIWDKKNTDKDDALIQNSEDITAPTDPPVDESGVPHATGESLPMNGNEGGLPQTSTETAPQTEESANKSPEEILIKVTFDGNFGYNAPDPTMYLYNPFDDPWIRLSLMPYKNPFRPGYHFMGWSTDPHAQEAEYKAYDMDWKFSKDTTLYAVWKDFDSSEFLPEHLYTIVQAKNNSPVVSITCSCSLHVSNKYIPYDDFVNMYFYWDPSTATTKEMNTMKRLFLLYEAQYIGPLALEYNTSFYKKDVKEAFTKLVSNLVDFADNSAETVDNLCKSEFYNWPELQELVVLDKKVVKNKIKQISKTADKVSKGVTLFQAANAFYKMGNSEAGLLTQTEGVLDFLDCVSSVLNVDDIVEPMTKTVKAGLKLVDQMEDVREDFVTLGDQTLNDVDEKYTSPLLSTVFPGKYPSYMLDPLITASGNHCMHNKADCLFNKPSDNKGLSRLHTFPTVYETLLNLQKWNVDYLAEDASILEQDKQLETDLKIVFFYLAERSRYELAQVAHGLTVEQYAKLVENTLPVAEYTMLF